METPNETPEQGTPEQGTTPVEPTGLPEAEVTPVVGQPEPEPEQETIRITETGPVDVRYAGTRYQTILKMGTVFVVVEDSEDRAPIRKIDLSVTRSFAYKLINNGKAEKVET